MTKLMHAKGLSTTEVAALLGVPWHRVENALRNGLVPPPEKIGRCRTWAPEDVERLRQVLVRRGVIRRDSEAVLS